MKTLKIIGIGIIYGFIGMCMFFWSSQIILSSFFNWTIINYFNTIGEGILELLMTIILLPMTIIFLVKKIKIDMVNLVNE